jgi:hypothetical protein
LNFKLDIGVGIDSVSFCIDDVWWRENIIKMRGTALSDVFNYFLFNIITCQNSTEENSPSKILSNYI